MRYYEGKGATFIDPVPRPGAVGLVSFMPPALADGVLVELAQTSGYTFPEPEAEAAEEERRRPGHHDADPARAGRLHAPRPGGTSSGDRRSLPARAPEPEQAPSAWEPPDSGDPDADRARRRRLHAARPGERRVAPPSWPEARGGRRRRPSWPQPSRSRRPRRVTVTEPTATEAADAARVDPRVCSRDDARPDRQARA